MSGIVQSLIHVKVLEVQLTWDVHVRQLRDLLANDLRQLDLVVDEYRDDALIMLVLKMTYEVNFIHTDHQRKSFEADDWWV